MKSPAIPLLLTASAAFLAGCGGTTQPGLTSLTLQPTAFALVVDEAVQLTVSRAPVAWTTSDATVAQVNSSGLVTGMTAGSATITAASGGDTARAAITVRGYTCLNQAGPTTTVSGSQTSAMDAQGDAQWSIRHVHVKYSRDDCVENDFLNSGTIDSSFFDGCYDGMSSDEYTSVLDGSSNLVVIRNSLWRLQAMDQAYSGPLPNHNAFWKWSAIGPKLALYDNVFRADEGSEEGNGADMFMAPRPGKLADCENNVMVWLGSGPFPETLPTTFNGKPCFTLMTGAAGLTYWNNAVAQWQANHPNTLADIGSPVVSLFSPGVTGSTTLAGTVDLTATAVDDRDVVGVQFQLNGLNIGSEVTTETSPTKYRLSWDSHGVANGPYPLTAIARDAAGNTTTSAGVTVTISN